MRSASYSKVLLLVSILVATLITHAMKAYAADNAAAKPLTDIGRGANPFAPLTGLDSINNQLPAPDPEQTLASTAASEPMDQMVYTPPPANAVPSPVVTADTICTEQLLDWLFETNAQGDMPAAILIGSAEGTRTPDGEKTRAYYGHRDPAKQLKNSRIKNLGSFSFRGHNNDITPERADQIQGAKLKSAAGALLAEARSKGVDLTLMQLIVLVDTFDQSQLAAAYFIDRLIEAQSKGLKSTDAAVYARKMSYCGDPPACTWVDAPGFGNDPYALSRDQDRRTEQLERAFAFVAKAAPRIDAPTSAAARAPATDQSAGGGQISPAPSSVPPLTQEQNLIAALPQPAGVGSDTPLAILQYKVPAAEVARNGGSNAGIEDKTQGEGALAYPDTSAAGIPSRSQSSASTAIEPATVETPSIETQASQPKQPPVVPEVQTRAPQAEDSGLEERDQSSQQAMPSPPGLTFVPPLDRISPTPLTPTGPAPSAKAPPVEAKPVPKDEVSTEFLPAADSPSQMLAILTEYYARQINTYNWCACGPNYALTALGYPIAKHANEVYEDMLYHPEWFEPVDLRNLKALEPGLIVYRTALKHSWRGHIFVVGTDGSTELSDHVASISLDELLNPTDYGQAYAFRLKKAPAIALSQPIAIAALPAYIGCQ